MIILSYPRDLNHTSNPVKGEILVYSGYDDAIPLSVEFHVHSDFTIRELRSWLVNQSELKINKEFEDRLNVHIKNYNNEERLGLFHQVTLENLEKLTSFELKVIHPPVASIISSEDTTTFFICMWGTPYTKHRIVSSISLSSLREQITLILQEKDSALLFSLYYIVDVNDPYTTRMWVGDDAELKKYLLFRTSRSSNNQLFLHTDTVSHLDNPLKPRSPIRPPAIFTNLPRSTSNSPAILSPKTASSSPKTLSSPKTSGSSPKTISSPISPPIPSQIPRMTFVPQHTPIKADDIISLEKTVQYPMIFRAWDGSRTPISDVMADLTTHKIGGSLIVKSPEFYWEGISFYTSVDDLKKHFRGKLSFVCKANTRTLLETSPDLQLIRDSRDHSHVGLAPKKDMEISEFEEQLAKLFESSVFIADIVTSGNSPSSISRTE